jgi:hypothetical protein
MLSATAGVSLAWRAGTEGWSSQAREQQGVGSQAEGQALEAFRGCIMTVPLPGWVWVHLRLTRVSEGIRIHVTFM